MTYRVRFEAYALVSEYALGAAISQIRAAHAMRDGQSPAFELRLLAHQEASDLPNLHRLAAADPLTLPPFATRIAAVLAGVAARYGAPEQDIAGLVEAAASEAAAGEATTSEAAAREATTSEATADETAADETAADEAGPVT